MHRMKGKEVCPVPSALIAAMILILSVHQCTLEMIDGSSWQGDLADSRGIFAAKGEGVLTLPDGRRVKVRMPHRRLWYERG